MLKKSLFSGANNNTAWLAQDDDEILFTLHLSKVRNPLDPDPLWDAQYSGGETIEEKSSQHKSRRLKQALDAHRHMSWEKQQFEFPVEKKLVFTDVVLWIPKKLWSLSDRIGGSKLFILAEKLKQRHLQDFSSQLLIDRLPRYAIMPLAELAADEVIFQFGLGVFVPDANDQRIAQISVSHNEQDEQQIPDWIMFENGSKITRPAGLYQQQSLLLIAAHLDQAALHSPVWFKQNSGYVLINHQQNPPIVDCDEHYINSEQVRQSAAQSIYSFCSTNSADDRVLISIKRYSEPVPKQTIEPPQSSQSFAGHTIIDSSETPEPIACALQLRGFILPRLEALRIAQLHGWQIHLDASGQAIDDAELIVHRLRCELLHALQWQASPNAEWQALSVPGEVLLNNGSSAQIITSPLHELHLGIYLLPKPMQLSLSTETMCLGRENADINLNLLDQNESLVWQVARPTSMSHIKLSAHHLQLQVNNTQLHIQQLSKNAPSYLLDKNDHLKAQLLPHSTEKMSLEIGEGLIVGNYLLRFV